MVSLASEFPNDNPALHRGVIWVCTEPTGGARPERSSDDGAATVVDPPVPASLGASAVAGAATEGSASAHDSLAPPEDDEIDEAAGPIVVEELEPIEASVEGGGERSTGPASDAATNAEVFAEALAPMPAASDVVLAAPAEAVIEAEPLAEAREHVAIADDAVEAVVEAPPFAGALAGREERGAIADGEIVAAEAPPAEIPATDGAGRSVVPAPAHSEVVLAGSRLEPPEDREDAGGAPSVAPVFEVIVASEVPHETTSLPPAPDDPFTVLVCTLADVAIGAGSPHVASLLPGLLFDGRLPEPLDGGAADALRAAGIWDGNEVAPAFVAVTAAWRAILRGTSDDFDACGAAMLDEWASDLLARLLEAPARAPMLRQELRSRGIAAFGLAA